MVCSLGGRIGRGIRGGQSRGANCIVIIVIVAWGGAAVAAAETTAAAAAAVETIMSSNVRESTLSKDTG